MPAAKFQKLPISLTRFLLTISLLVLVAVSVPSFALDPKENHSTPPATPSMPRIEPTNYTPPSNSIYVNQSTGKSTNSGTQSNPLQTLEQAINKAPSGSTIIVASGTYREGNLKVTKNLTIQAAPNSQVWFDGSEPTSGWTPDSAGGYRLSNSPSSNLCTLGSRCLDAADQINPNYPMSWSPQMVFINDVPLTEVSTRAQATRGNTFYYDIPTKTLFIGANPTGAKVDVTTKRKFLDIAATKGAIRGIGVRRYGSILNPNNIQNSYHGAALILAEGGMGRPNSFIFENNTFFQNASKGLSINYTDGTIVRGNAFLSNGSNGFDAFRSDSMLVEKNLIRDNNTERFAISNTANSVIAGTKMVRVTNSTIRNNIVEFNRGTGIWCDISCISVKYYGNVVHSNENHGIFYELSETGTIASNLIFRNKGDGIKITSPNTKIVNNTLVDNGNNIAIYEDNRRVTSSTPYTETRNTTIVNNLLSTSSSTYTNKLVEINGFNLPDSAVPSQMVTELNYNAYYRSNPAKPSTVIGYRGAGVSKSYSDVAKAQIDKLETNGIGLDGSSNTLFVNAANNDFKIHAQSRAKTGSKPLGGALAYIAQDLGLSSTQSYNRGAIVWQNMSGTPGTGTTTTPGTGTTTTPGTGTTTTPGTGTTTTKPGTITTTTKPVTTIPKPIDIAIKKIISDFKLAKLKVYKYNENTLTARAYLNTEGFVYIAIDFSANIGSKGNYTITHFNLILSLWPIS